MSVSQRNVDCNKLESNSATESLVFENRLVNGGHSIPDIKRPSYI